MTKTAFGEKAPTPRGRTVSRTTKQLKTSNLQKKSDKVMFSGAMKFNENRVDIPGVLNNIQFLFAKEVRGEDLVFVRCRQAFYLGNNFRIQKARQNFKRCHMKDRRIFV